ncbi:hypothetical protein [Gaetbulibacter aestuarii]|uniref:Tetratricopeptide repeat protein n=1 Tax=Gaetbulibacter aestuarii TaxID=1502358 RepID=A0ABW7N013_9FLAO
MQFPQTITHQNTEAIKSIIQEFPYFQSARALYLKGLKNESSFKYNQELKKTATYTTDRSILFDFITSDHFNQNEISRHIKQNSSHLKNIEVDVEDISVNKSVVIDHALKQQIKESEAILDPALFEPKVARPPKPFALDESESIKEIEAPIETEPASPEEILKLGKPLQFDKNESHSFNEWLKLTKFKPIKREEDEKIVEVEEKPEMVSERAKKFELIDKFISENPKITPSKNTSTKKNLAKAQMIQPEALMTETLARIYVEQKNYKKAIQSYKILSLKYPEKSSFFANQIKAVEQLQEQNNKD